MTSMFASAASMLLALACTAGPTDTQGTAPSPTDGGATQTTDTATTSADGTTWLTDANNYRFSGVLDGPSFSLAEYVDNTISWATLDRDLQCHELDPVKDIDNVALMVFPYLTELEVEQGLSTDSLEQVDIAVYLSVDPGDGTQISLSDLTFFGTEANIQEEFDVGSGTWLMTFTTGSTVGVGSRMLAFLSPTAGETATQATVTDGCGVLEVDVSLSKATPISLTASGPWALDWSGLAHDAQGLDFNSLAVTDLMVAYYADLSPADLESNFLDLELLATDLWTASHPSGTSTDLSALTNAADGSAFPGFQADGTWLFALRCSTCPNPAPLFLTVVQPAR